MTSPDDPVLLQGGGRSVVHRQGNTAWEADDAAITPETTAHPIALWAMAWRARSAAWMIRHRRTLETALAKGAA